MDNQKLSMKELHDTYDIINRLSPFIRRAWDHTMPVGWYQPDRIIFDYEIFYVMEGFGTVIINKQEYSAQPGDLFFFRPLAVHSIKSMGPIPLRQPHIHFDFFFQDNSEEVYIPIWQMTDPGLDAYLIREDILQKLHIPDKITVRDKFVLEHMLFGVISEDDSLKPSRIIKQKAYFLDLLSYILDECGNINENLYWPQSTVEVMEHAKQYVISCVNMELNLPDMAKSIGISQNYLCRLYKDYYGLTPVKFHMKLKIDKAKHMLLTGKYTVTEVALALGFDNIHNFSRTFKREAGISPQYFSQAAILA